MSEQTPHDKIINIALGLANTQIAELYPHNARSNLLPKQRVYEALVHVAYEMGMILVNSPSVDSTPKEGSNDRTNSAV
jgi:hypothetical protein